MLEAGKPIGSLTLEEALKAPTVNLRPARKQGARVRPIILSEP
jgi:hypothetical protein